VALLVGLIAAQVVVSGALFVFMAGIAFEELHGSGRQLGVLISALGIGGLIGAAGSLGVIGSKLVRSDWPPAFGPFKLGDRPSCAAREGRAGLLTRRADWSRFCVGGCSHFGPS
jgi:hypothetical protein